jgi:hypothetical protein
LSIANSGSGAAFRAEHQLSLGTAVAATANADSGIAVDAVALSTNSTAIRATANHSGALALRGNNPQGVAIAAAGQAGVVATGIQFGLVAQAAGSTSVGAFVTNTATSGLVRGVHAQVSSSEGVAVYGHAISSTGDGTGVLGTASSPNGFGVRARIDATSSGSGAALRARSEHSDLPAARLINAALGRAADIYGDVSITGNISKSGGSFKIDHPLDPENKYLYHSFVESDEMKNIYDGNVVTDAKGRAIVEMPSWFDALNRDFRYQLTVHGKFAQAIVEQEIVGNSFVIRTSLPQVKVSWQVTGVREDHWAEKHRIPVEQEKPTAEKGRYLHPEVFGQPKSLQVGFESTLMDEVLPPIAETP